MLEGAAKNNKQFFCRGPISMLIHFTDPAKRHNENPVDFPRKKMGTSGMSHLVNKNNDKQSEQLPEIAGRSGNTGHKPKQRMKVYFPE
jgi:hypothetical protein